MNDGAHYSSQPLVDPARLDYEPTILFGLTHSELMTLIQFGLPFWVVFGILFSWLAGAFFLGLTLAGLGEFATVYILGQILAEKKRQRPEGYYQQQLIILMNQAGITPSAFIAHEGNWDKGRSI